MMKIRGWNGIGSPLKSDGKSLLSFGSSICTLVAHLIPNPIAKVLSTLSSQGVRHLLMGGQACVFYGAAEFSRDCDIVVVAEPENLQRLNLASRL